MRKPLGRRLQQIQSALRIRSAVSLLQQYVGVSLDHFRIVWACLIPCGRRLFCFGDTESPCNQENRLASSGKAPRVAQQQIRELLPDFPSLLGTASWQAVPNLAKAKYAAGFTANRFHPMFDSLGPISLHLGPLCSQPQ